MMEAIITAINTWAMTVSLFGVAFSTLSLFQSKRDLKRWSEFHAKSQDRLQNVLATIDRLEEADKLISPWLKEMRDHPLVGDDLCHAIDRWFYVRRKGVTH
jgi:hypothetical protein